MCTHYIAIIVARLVPVSLVHECKYTTRLASFALVLRHGAINQSQATSIRAAFNDGSSPAGAQS